MKIFERLHRYGGLITTHDLFKAIAIVTMVIDHVGLYLVNNNYWMRDIGRSATPLFFFVVGTTKSFRFKPSLLFYGLLLTLITYLTEDEFYFNILLSFIIIKWVLSYYNPKLSSNRSLVLIFIILVVLQIFLYDWLEFGSSGLLFAFAGRLISQRDPRGAYWAAPTLIFYFLTESYSYNFFANLGYTILFVVIILLLGISMINFKPRTWSMPSALRYPTLFLSRYSLEIYFIHLAGLMIYSYWEI